MSGDGAWRVTASRPVLRDRWIDLRADDCVTPAGAPIAPYYVLRYPDWVNVVALTGDDRLVMVRQYRHAVGETLLELPGGVIDAADGDPAAAARRELREETGHDAALFRHVCTLNPNPATHTNRIHTYLATGVARTGTQALEAGEHGMSVHLVPVAEVLRGLRTGLVGQAMHVSAILLGLAEAGRIGLIP